MPEEEDIPYGDMLEKKYQFNPIPEAEKPALVPAPAPVAPVKDIAKEEIQEIEQDSSMEQTKVEDLLDTKLQTDVQKKFGELFFTTKKIYELRNIEDSFDIL